MNPFLKIEVWLIYSITMCQFLVHSKMIQLHTHTHSFSYAFPLCFIIGYRVQFPVLYSRALVLTCFIYSGVYLLIPNSYFLPPSPPFPFGNHMFVFCLCICFINRFIRVLFQIPYISDIIWYLSSSSWLTSLSMIISRLAHVVVNVIISFFFMTK